MLSSRFVTVTSVDRKWRTLIRIHLLNFVNELSVMIKINVQKNTGNEFYCFENHCSKTIPKFFSEIKIRFIIFCKSFILMKYATSNHLFSCYYIPSQHRRSGKRAPIHLHIAFRNAKSIGFIG